MFVRNATIGADIEVFLRDRESKEIVSAEGLIQGTKTEPFFFMPGNNFFATSLDNVMAEFCIPPAKTAEEFSSNIALALAHIENTIPKNLEVHATPATFLDEKYLQTENALLFGCEPDMNIWTLLQNMPPQPPDGEMRNLRSAGGHIHVGYDTPDRYITSMLLKAMDLFIGVPSVILEPANKRKELYGKAGAFRVKPYGFEYRTVSNFYLQSKQLTEWVFNQTRAAIDFVNAKKFFDLEEDDFEAIQLAINNADAVTAEYLIERFEIKLAA